MAIALSDESQLEKVCAGFMVSAERLRLVISSAPGVSVDTRAQVLAALEERLLKGASLVDSFQLGIAFGALIRELPDADGVVAIASWVSNLDRLPFVEIRGDPV